MLSSSAWQHSLSFRCPSLWPTRNQESARSEKDTVTIFIPLSTTSAYFLLSAHNLRSLLHCLVSSPVEEVWHWDVLQQNHTRFLAKLSLYNENLTYPMDDASWMDVLKKEGESKNYTQKLEPHKYWTIANKIERGHDTTLKPELWCIPTTDKQTNRQTNKSRACTLRPLRIW